MALFDLAHPISHDAMSHWNPILYLIAFILFLLVANKALFVYFEGRQNKRAKPFEFNETTMSELRSPLKTLSKPVIRQTPTVIHTQPEEMPPKKMRQQVADAPVSEKPRHRLVLTDKNPTYSTNFWAFKLETAQPYEIVQQPLVAVLPIAPGSKAAACLLQPIGLEYLKSPSYLPMLEHGGKPISADFIHPKGASVNVDASIGFLTNAKDRIGIIIDLSRSPLPAFYYTQGVFTIFKGKDCGTCGN